MGRHHADDSVFNGCKANILLIHQEQPPRGPQQNFGILRALCFEQFDQRVQLFLARGAGALDLLPRFFNGLANAFLVERLQDVVDRVHLEGLDRVLIVGSGEDDLRYRDLSVYQFLYDAESVQAGHLAIEKNQLGGMFLDQVDRLQSVTALGHDVDVLDRLQKVAQLVASQLLVIDYDCGKRHSVSIDGTENETSKKSLLDPVDFPHSMRRFSEPPSPRSERRRRPKLIACSPHE